jgi:hypothetical protein
MTARSRVPCRPSRVTGCFLVAVLLLFVAMQFVYAAPRSLLTSFGNFAIRAPGSPAGSRPPDFYAASGPDPGWQILQWDIPAGRLSPFRTKREGAREVLTATSPEATVRLVRGPGRESITLTQDGAVLPCLTARGEPRESDLLFGPKDRSVPGPNALTTDPVPLASIRSLVLGTTVTFRINSTSRPKGCSVNQNMTAAAVVLNDRVTRPPQTFFYQLALAPSCGPDSVPRWQPCDTGGHAAWFYSSRKPFGADDYLPNLGEPFLKNGERRALTVDMLPRIMRLIESGPEPMDHDPRHWEIDNFYAGQAIWGDLRLSTTWEGFQIVATRNRQR